MRVALLLAAGSSRRFGPANKLLARSYGRPLIAHALAAARAAPVARIYVVTGADRARVAAAVRGGGRPAVRTVHARAHREGLAASLRAGIAALPARVQAAFLFLGDMPAVPHGVARLLLRRRATPVRPVVAGRPGHPVLIGRAEFPAIAALRGEHGLRGLAMHRLILPAHWRGCLRDVDRPGQLKPLLQ